MKKTEDTKPQSKVKTAVRKVKYEFNDDELKNLGLKLAGQVAQKRNIENDKKHVMSQYKTKTEEVIAQIEETQLKLTGGFELRDQNCTIELDWDNNKKTYRLPDGTEVDSEPLTREDYQHQLALDNKGADSETPDLNLDAEAEIPKKSRVKKEKELPHDDLM